MARSATRDGGADATRSDARLLTPLHVAARRRRVLARRARARLVGVLPARRRGERAAPRAQGRRAPALHRRDVPGAPDLAGGRGVDPGVAPGRAREP